MNDNVTYDASLDEQMEERSKTTLTRESSETIKVGDRLLGKITEYSFHILVRDKETLSGNLSREQMNLIYKLYSSEGANLSQREVSRYYSDFTFQEFKKILRAFNITKASAPLAPHVIEEKTQDELVQLTLDNKESNYLKKLEHDRSRLTESKLKESTKKFDDLKRNVQDFTEFIETIHFKVEPVEVRKPKYFNNKTLIIYISDMHIGAEVSNYSVYDNKFNMVVAQNRLKEVQNKIFDVCRNFEISNIVVCNIGDSLDGYNAVTTRGGHILPQNMNNKDQFKNYLKLMLDFFGALSNSSLFNDIKYYCVEGGNHEKILIFY